jgi:hypothetical protein
MKIVRLMKTAGARSYGERVKRVYAREGGEGHHEGRLEDLAVDEQQR